ncbi:hypothetical protein [Aquimarina sp. MMG016]|uniref:hypothetical protein n=1 Tax=Aquimarina sp. MMG016 TaxID=2822690 RepID=UPI001B3A0570|nr:hypothetical protein [Aquimarina sp. MMG016]MBQ4821841.1 hypothetical protein [Aquimarina sp. MMG016]
MRKTKKAKMLLLFLCLPLLFFGQQKNESEYYNWFDTIIGKEHTGLYNGKQYVDLDINKILNNKHAFFFSDEVLTGSVIYDGQPYYNVGIKYNLEQDKLLIALKPGSSASVMQLIYDKVEEFTINDYRFIRVENIDKKNYTNGFHQVLLDDNEILLLKKHTKSKIKSADDLEGNKQYYEYRSKSKYVLYFDQDYKGDIKSKTDIITIFPELKKEIKQFYKAHKLLRRKNPDAFMKKIFAEIINPSSKNES